MTYTNEAGGAFTEMAKRNCLVNGLDVAHLISASEAMDPHSSGRYVINATSAAALTLGAPTAGIEDGLCIQLSSSTNYAHTLTATGLLQTGSASVNEATFAAYAGAGLTLQAFNGYWIVQAPNGITFPEENSMATNTYFPETQDLKLYQPESMLADLAQAGAIKSAQQQQQQSAQAFPLEQQQRQQQNQITGMQLQDMQTIRQLLPQYVQRDAQGKPSGYDINGLVGAGAQAGVSPQVLQQLQMQHLDLTQKYAAVSAANRANLKAQNDAAYELLEGIRSLPDPAQKQQAYQKGLPNLQALGMNTDHLPQQVPTDDASLNALEATLGMHEQALADAKTQGEAQEAAGKGAQAQSEAALNNIKVRMAQNSKPGDFDSQIDQLSPPGSDLNRQAKAMVNSSLSRGDFEGAKQALDQTFQQVGAIGKETNPAVISARAQEAAQTATAVEQAHQKMYPAALAGVPQNLIQPASADATKADQAYTQAQQAGNEMQNMVKLAKAGNKIAYAYSPVTGVLQINVAGQIKRMNMPEIESYGGAGSAFDRINGFIGKQATGADIPKNVLGDMDTVSRMVTAGAQTKYQQDLSALNARYGAKFQPMNIPQQSGSFDVTDPRGVTHRFPTQQAADNFKRAAGIQ